MSERAWYRSLYWRIAAGFILFLATMLVAQAGLFLWLAIGSSASGLAPDALDDLSRVVASDLERQLRRDRATSVEAHLRERYADVGAMILVVYPGGRVISSAAGVPPERLVRLARMSFRRRPARPGRPAFGPGPGPRAAGVAPVIVGGRVRAVVVVARDRPWRSVVRELGPLMVGVAGLLLLSGTGLAALLIFRPAHRRLRALERATASLGAGDLSARAPVDGGDEIATVSGAFNRMAGELQGRERDLQEADRTRRQLLADVSHELMTPLTTIRGYLETLRMSEIAIDEATRQRYLAIMADEAHRLEQLTGDLLELARFEAGGISLTPTEVSVADLFERVSARHGRAAAERGVTLEIVIARDATSLRGDAARLEQAIQNLAANSLRHTREGGRITLGAGRDGDIIVLAVTDDGEGIPAGHLPHVFDRFYKADESRAGALGGSGLGLSIVKAIVELHGGTIEARSRPGVETVFEIRLLAPVQAFN